MICVSVEQGEVDAVFVNAILSGIQLRNLEVSSYCVILVPYFLGLENCVILRMTCYWYCC